MFEHCSTLGALNQERQALIRSGADTMEVNSAYNRAKKLLVEQAPVFRTIPTYSGEGEECRGFVSFPFLKGKGAPNEIVITPGGVLL